MNILIVIMLALKGNYITSLELDYMSCGIEPDADVRLDSGPVDRFPWLGILYYNIDTGEESERATTMVILIHRQYALGASGDIVTIPKRKLRTNTKVLIGEDWSKETAANQPGIGVVSYSVHPEYKVKTLNTLAIVKLESMVQKVLVWPICPPTAAHLPHTPLFNVIIEDVMAVKKVLRRMNIVSQMNCNEFYKNANLSLRLMRPTLSLCAAAQSERDSCVWEGGSALASRDPWGRWRLVGFGVRGPGCGAPSRYLDIIRFLPWIEDSYQPEQYLAVHRTAPNMLYLRRQYRVVGRGKHAYRYKEYNTYGDCEGMDGTKFKTLYEEESSFTCDQLQPVTGHYKFVLIQNVNYTCIQVATVSAVNAAQPYVWIVHSCPNAPQGQMCHQYTNTTGTVKLNFVFTFKMTILLKYVGIVMRKGANETDMNIPDAKLIKEQVMKQWLENAM